MRISVRHIDASDLYVFLAVGVFVVENDRELLGIIETGNRLTSKEVITSSVRSQIKLKILAHILLLVIFMTIGSINNH